jgi:uncharacterized protein (DUF4415 family)
MKRSKPLSDADGEVRELTLEDMKEMVPLSGLPASLQAKIKKMGRPISESKKRAVSIRLDPDVLDAVKATGDGWQTRINDVLRSQFIKRSHK